MGAFWHLVVFIFTTDIGVALVGAVLGALIVGLVFKEYKLIRREEAHLPILAWVGVFFYVGFVAPIPFGEDAAREDVAEIIVQNPGVVAATLGLAILAYVLISLTSEVVRRIVRRHREADATSFFELARSRFRLGVLSGAVVVVVPVTIWVYLVEFQGPWYRGIVSFLFDPTVLLVILLGEHFVSTADRRRSLRRLLMIYVIGLVGAGLISARMRYVVEPLVIVGVWRYAIEGRLPVKWIAVAVVLMMIIQPVKQDYRRFVGFRTDAFRDLSVGEAYQAWSTAMLGESGQTVTTGGDGSQDISARIGSVVQRMGVLGLNATVIKQVPRPFGYVEGETIWPTFQNWVPRAVWREKPSLTVETSDYFNRTFGFQTWEQTQTNTRILPLLGEAYWNWWIPGVLGVAIVVGVFVGVLAGIWHPSGGLLAIIPVVLLVQMFATNSFASAFGGVPQQIVGAILMWYGLRVGSTVYDSIRVGITGGKKVD